MLLYLSGPILSDYESNIDANPAAAAAAAADSDDNELVCVT